MDGDLMSFFPTAATGGTGSLKFIDRITTSGSVQSVEFGATGDGEFQAALDGNKDIAYYVRIRMDPNFSGTTAWSLRPNGSTSNTLETNITRNIAGVASDSRVTDLRWATGTAGNFCGAEFWIHAADGDRRTFFSRWQMSDGSNSLEYGHGGGHWGSTNADITSLELRSDFATGIASGSVFELFKLENASDPVPLGAMEFLDRITVTTAQTTVTFSDSTGDGEFGFNINGDEDEYYVLKYRIIKANASTMTLRPNGLTSNLLNEGLSTNSETPTYTSSSDWPIGGSASTFDEFVGEVRLEAKTGFSRAGHNWLFDSVSGVTPRFHTRGFVWNDSSTNITSFDITSSLASGIDVGSTFELYRIRSRPTLRVPTVSIDGELWTPPAIAHPDDDEFTGNVLSGDWTVTPAADTATIDPYAAPATGPRIQLNRRRSWLQMQPEDGTNCYVGKAITLPTNFAVWARMTQNYRDGALNANDILSGIGFSADVSGTANDSVTILLAESDAGEVEVQFDKRESTSITVINELPHPGLGAEGMYYEYVGIQKIGTTYHGWVGSSNGNWYHMGSSVFAGGTLDNIVLIAGGTSTGLAPGTPIVGWDFVRFEESATALPK